MEIVNYPDSTAFTLTTTRPPEFPYSTGPLDYYPRIWMYRQIGNKLVSFVLGKKPVNLPLEKFGFGDGNWRILHWSTLSSIYMTVCARFALIKRGKILESL